MLTAECKFRNTEKAKLLIRLLEDNGEYPMRYYIDAASNYNTFEDAQRFLNQPCPICDLDYPMDDVSCCALVCVIEFSLFVVKKIVEVQKSTS